jgi:hypothetical protein
MAPSANHIAFTAPINPSGATPILTRSQIWSGLRLKIRSAETFVPGGINSTVVLSEDVDPISGNPVTVREVVFVEGQRKATERVTAYEDSRVEFVQEDGSTVQNVVSEDENGELYLTYIFEWRHPGVSEAELKALAEKEKNLSKMAVIGTIAAMRKLVQEGKI